MGAQKMRSDHIKKLDEKTETGSYENEYMICAGSSEQSYDCENAIQYLLIRMKKKFARGIDLPKALRNITKPDSMRFIDC